ncbi:glycosyltransferase family 2 protein [Planktothrix agardhii 1033]|nr:glycosyltransferase family 2 protein [Planktothrix agardhii 1033]MCF3609333.1 glycosyltransferase family 2 protein [Planktothrix agardhii 1033]
MSNISETPQISVIIPAYNCDRYVEQAVESVINQTYPADEIIIIDDGSQDNTRQVLQPYSNYIHYVYQENQGVSVARNHGLKLGLVQSGWRRVNQQGKTIMDATPWDYVPELNLENWLRWKPLGTMGTLMFRREWLLKIEGFEPGLAHAEDVDLILRMVLLGCESAWLHQPTVCYRQHDRNTMRDGVSQAKSINYVLDKFFNLPNIPLEIRLIENWVRYSTLVWSSWYLYYTRMAKFNPLGFRTNYRKTFSIFRRGN